jgi:glycosyltransferase involved in cell wall biosynthesis
MSERIRVCQLTPCLWSGGTEQRVAQIFSRIDPKRFETSWMGFGPVREALAEQSGCEQAPIAIPRHAHRGVEPSIVLRIARHLAYIRPHILHVHNWSTGLYGVAAAQMTGVPCVFYGSGGREIQAGAQSRRLRLMRALGPHIDGFTSVCAFLGREVAENFGVEQARIHVVKTGVDLDEMDRAASRQQARKQLGIPQDAIVVGTICVFRPVKRIDDLIAAVGQLAKANPKLHLLLIGNPVRMSIDDLRKHAAEQGLEGRVHLPGRLEYPAELIKAFDIFVNCSDFEGLSGSIVEAMAAGLSVVASDVGGTPELIQHEKTGLLVEARNVSALAKAIQNLSQDEKQREHFGRAARAHAQIHHDKRNTFAAYESLYENAFEQSERGQFRRRLRQAKRGVQSLRRILRPV